MIPFLKVQHTNPSNAIFDLSPYVLSLQISKGSEATKNTLTLELQNHNGVLNTQNFEMNNSSIIVWMDWDSVSTSEEPIISTTLSSISYPMENNGKYKLKLKGTDKTGMLLSKLWAEAITEDTSFDASDAIVNIVGHLNDLDGDSISDLTTTNVATTKADGSAFPKPISISKIWKPGYEWLNDLSQTDYTGEDRPYVYYIDANNDLHWHYPYQKPITTLTSDINTIVTTIPVNSTTGYPSSGTIVIEDEIISYTGKTTNSFTGCTRGYQFSSADTHTSGTEVSGLYLYLGRQDIYSMNIGTTEDSTYNFIIYNGGMTPVGYEYLDYTLDYKQVGKKFRMKFFDWKSVAKDMTNREKARSEWGTDKTTSYPEPGDNPLGEGNPYTPYWTTTAVTSNSGYQESFEEEVRKRCVVKAKAYFMNGQQKYQCDVQMRGTTAYEVNDLVNVVSPKFSLILLLRVKDVKHQLNKGSWITDISLQSDPEIIASNE